MSRLNKLERALLLKKSLFPERPEFENWSDKKLIQFVKDSIERTHKEQGIKNCVEGVEYYIRLFDTGGIPTKEELKLHLQMEKEYWDGIYN